MMAMSDPITVKRSKVRILAPDWGLRGGAYDMVYALSHQLHVGYCIPLVHSRRSQHEEKCYPFPCWPVPDWGSASLIR